MTVLIAGAGIAGLTLGLSLHEQNIPFRIIEAVSKLTPLGVGINLQPHAIRELTEMGMGETLDQIGIKTKAVGYYNRFGAEILTEPRGTFAGYHWPQYSIHRGELQMALFDRLANIVENDVITTGVRIESFDQDPDGVVVKGRDKQGRAFDAKGSVLIAGDGIHSAIRSQLYPDEQAPVWGGTIMWRGTTRAPAFLSGATMAMIGIKDQKFVTYPIHDYQDGTQLINWIADLTMPADYMWNKEDWNRQGVLDEFAPKFQDWKFDWLDVPALIDQAKAVFEYPMIDRDPLPKWSFDRVTLIGDAAHAMYPIGSNGASQAILDARVLTKSFMDQSVGAEALSAYENQRREPVNKLVLANRGDGPDKVLDLVEERAPDGFATIDDVFSAKELAQIGEGYRKLAGFDVKDLNERQSIVR